MYIYICVYTHMYVYIYHMHIHSTLLSRYESISALAFLISSTGLAPAGSFARKKPVGSNGDGATTDDLAGDSLFESQPTMMAVPTVNPHTSTT